MDILMKDPHDFICPLTGQLFEDPVTLETGQNFEREAIGEWFDQGNRTCPVTGKALACSTVPLANSILKKFGQRKTLSGQRKTLSGQRKTLSSQF
ncbi:hypothetical protein NC652_000253 [Populus alba x Populus x berolinensis]|nr:hypothetical protein NC652_000253 [Populus alba x Populus x berolinensis]